MSTEPDRFEQDLADVPRTALPASFRDEILSKACVATPPQPKVLARLWNSTPKPIATAVAGLKPSRITRFSASRSTAANRVMAANTARLPPLK